MRILPRAIEPVVKEASRAFPAVVITGPRRAGKTTLLRRMFPKASYVLLEDPDVQARVRSDPRALLDEVRPPVIFDEIQNVPELLNYVRTRIDTEPRKKGQWMFTGSQEAPLMRHVSESMAGRAAVLQLLPFGVGESPKVGPLTGGYPEVLGKPNARDLWFSSYIQTYLERDVRTVSNIRDLILFRRFLALVASRHGQMLNKTDIAAPLGVSVPTITEWLHILEVTAQILVVPPYFENFGKRLIKTPKVYVADSGMACHLLGIRTQSDLDRSPFLGAIFEGFVGSEIVKNQVNRGRRPELYYFRDQQGLEVDFLFPSASGQGLWMAECKATKTVQPAMARSLTQLGGSEAGVRKMVIHRKPVSSRSGIQRTLIPGVEALDWQAFVAELNQAGNKKRRT